MTLKKSICTMCYQSIVELPIKHMVNVVTLERQQRSNLIFMFLLRQKTISKASQKSRKKILHPSWSMQVLWVRQFVWLCTMCLVFALEAAAVSVTWWVLWWVFVLFYLLLSIIHNSDFSGWTLLSLGSARNQIFLRRVRKILYVLGSDPS